MKDGPGPDPASPPKKLWGAIPRGSTAPDLGAAPTAAPVAKPVATTAPVVKPAASTTPIVKPVASSTSAPKAPALPPGPGGPPTF
jgi:hypothetical protein